MPEENKRWTKAAKAIGGLAAVLTLLAHFWLPALPLTPMRVQLLLVLIGALLGLDMLFEHVPVSIDTSQTDDGDNQND